MKTKEQMGGAAGLEGIVAARSAITYVDGAAGELRYRGYSVPELARAVGFEATAALLWDGEVPASTEPIRAELEAGRALDPEMRALVEAMSPHAAPLEVLRTLVSSASARDGFSGGNSREANRAKAARLTSLVHAGVAAIASARTRRPVPDTRPGETAARALLRALAGREPSADEERVFDAILVLHADHELNASTFAARIVAATEEDMTGAVTAAVAALQGPKHGGANEDVAEMIAEIGDPARARGWAEAKLARYRAMTPEERKAPDARFAGFGHRVYKVDDPRAVALRDLALASASDEGVRRSLEIAEEVRDVVQTGLGLILNVDYYSAVVYVGLGIEPAMFTSVFAASRVAGWCAHIAEQHADNRLIRPRAEYVGPTARAVTSS
jgi:2-methylcitrate synthase